MSVPFSPVFHWNDGQIKVPLAPLVNNALESTYLTADMAIGTAMTVRSTKGLHATTNQPFIIGELGNEVTELVESTTTTAPSTITLSAASTFAHNTGDTVYLIKFDQIEFSHSATLAGSKVVLSANSGLYSIQPDKKEFILDEIEFTTGFYFVRFKESVGGTFSDYSDGLEVGGWSPNTVGYLFNKAMNELEIDYSKKVTVEDLFDWSNEGLRHIQGKLKRWPEHYTYNKVLGQAQRGTNVLTMPTDAYDTDTNKSIIAFRIGDNPKLTYLSPVQFEEEQGDVKVTQVTTQASAGDLTLEIDNSYDFADSGSVNVYISNVKYNVTYTGVTRSDTAGILTGVPAAGTTGAITVTIPVDTYVWSDENEGIPRHFTVRNGQLEWWFLTDASEDNANITADYAKIVTVIDSLGDTIDYQRYDMIKAYLTWRIKMKVRNNGELDFQDGYFTHYKIKLNDTVRTLPQNNIFPYKPKQNKMSKRGVNPAKHVPFELQ